MKRLFLSRKGFELSINFIVMLIITIIVFGASIVIAKKVMDAGNDISSNVDRQTKERLESLITSGNEGVVIAFPTLEAKPGQEAIFGIGIMNTIGEQKTFYINVTPNIMVLANGSQSTDTNWKNSWGYPKSGIVTVGEIKNNAYTIHPILIKAGNDARRGATYSFSVSIFYLDSGTYKPYPLKGNTKIIRVTVK